MRRTRAFALVCGAALLACAALAAAQHAGHDNHRFRDAQKWAQVFDDPARDAWQKPREVITALALAPDATVADIGAGTGYFAARLAHGLPRGRVYAVDLEPDMVSYLGERAQKEGLANLVAVAGAADSPRLPAPVDLVILVDVYHHIAAREAYFARLRESLRPDGRIAVIDFRIDATIGPGKAMRIAPERVRDEMARAGYAQAAAFDFLPQQYFLVFRPR